MNKIANIWSRPSVRNIGKLLSANIFAQAIGLLIYPLLTRLYTPEDFGLLNLFTSIGGVLVVLSTLDWNKAIVLPKHEEEASAVAHLSLIVVGILTAILVLTIPFAQPIADLFNTPALATYYWLLPAYVCLMGLWNILNYWFIRFKAYNRISGYQISQSLFSAGYKSGFGFLGYLGGGLIYASVLSPLCSLTISVAISAQKHLRPLSIWKNTVYRYVAAKYSNFPKFSLPHSLINNIAGQLPVLLLTPFFGPRLVGFWGIALLLSYTPISMITNALYQVFYQNTSERVNAGKSIAPFYRQFTTWAVVVIVPFFTALWFVLPWLTQWLLGEEWRVSGEYIRWLLPWLLFRFLCSSTGYLYDVFSKQKIGLYFEIIIALARLLALGVGIYVHDFTVAIACYAIVSALINAVQYIWMMSFVKHYEQKLTV